MKSIKNIIFISFFITICSVANSQNIQSLPDIMGDKFPEGIVNNFSYRFSFIDTIEQKQLIQIRNPNTNESLYVITDGTAENSAFYGRLDRFYDLYKDGEHFSFIRQNPIQTNILELLRYDAVNDTLQVSNSIELPNLDNTIRVVALDNETFALFDFSFFQNEYKLLILQPESDSFNIIAELNIPNKQVSYHSFISNEEYLFLGNDDDNNLIYSKFNINTLESTSYGIVRENSPLNSISIAGEAYNDKYEAVVIAQGDLMIPVLFDKEQETLTILETLPGFGSISNIPPFSFILTDKDFFIYNGETGNIEQYNFEASTFTTIPYPNRGSIEYTGRIDDFLVKGDTILFSKRTSPSFNWNEYFYFNREDNELEIIVDDYYESNGFASRGAGMFLLEDKILLGYKFGFDDCAVMILEENLTDHILFDLMNEDFCISDLMVNNNYVIFHSFSNILVLERDEDQDGYDVWEDCNDTDPLINQDANEIEGNEVDENCDGLLTNIFDISKDNNEIFISPNPARSIVNISLPFLPVNEKAILQLYNLTGQNLIEKELYFDQNQQVWQLTTESLKSGTYILTVNLETQLLSKKITIIK